MKQKPKIEEKRIQPKIPKCERTFSGKHVLRQGEFGYAVYTYCFACGKINDLE